MPTVYRFLDIYTVEYINKKGATIKGAKVVFLACAGGKYYDTFTTFTSNLALIKKLSETERETVCKPIFDYKARLVDVNI